MTGRRHAQPAPEPAAGRHLPRTGDVYTWHGITITIGEIGPRGAWCMIHCKIVRETGWPSHEHTWTQEWDKQHPFPTLPADWIPQG